MLWNVVNPPKNLPAENISGLSTAQTLELCDPEVLLFQEPLQNSEVTSTSNCCHEDTSHFFKTTDKNGTKITAATDGCSLPELIFDNDIYVSTDFALSSFIPPIFPNNYQEDQLSLLDQSQSLSQEAAVVNNGLPAYPHDDHFAPIAGPTIIMPSLLEERCLSLMPNSYMRLSSFLGSANTVLGPSLPCNLSSAVLSDDNSGIFNGSTEYVGTRVLQNQDLEEVLQGDINGGIFSSDPLPGIYGSSGPLPGIYDSSVLQASLSNERQHAVHDGGSSTPLDTDISSLEDSAIKAAAKCSVEERKDKIDRYLKKRNERNFSKKIKVHSIVLRTSELSDHAYDSLDLISAIKDREPFIAEMRSKPSDARSDSLEYACRKTLADRRPRVRGRFARNDEFLCHETPRGSYNGNNEEYKDENVSDSGRDA